MRPKNIIWMVVNNACLILEHWPYGQKNGPENVNHVTACLQRFIEDAKIQEESEEEETVEEEEAGGCRDFQLVPREMQGRRKDRLSEYVGFYDSLFEKPRYGRKESNFKGLGKRCVGHGSALSEGRFSVVSHYGKTGHV
ncbi:hypothetical protein TNCV_2750321 [Trichonephila clavipes]|nr:hypothetical protein TNCV_2750321 [Trichonephila clavipes]